MAASAASLNFREVFRWGGGVFAWEETYVTALVVAGMWPSFRRQTDGQRRRRRRHRVVVEDRSVAPV